ncbi:OsmC family protein [Variovorax guangxiensis]|uniref:OsmC family protein n=1 Tax=Variovorax guangxiensis TaxID=1775474 RepID=UPI0028603D07|nr:OsmC family protein [Variovorax guangxiensis]MDR6853821.1 putative OsmC-like protein [Variovorax guangxiensis]
MSMQDIAAAMQRAQAALERRPDMGLHDDAPATARWQGGVRVESSHANGTAMLTDMPCELGGSGDRVTPGWLFRAGIASCAATSIAMSAAAEGIALGTLEVRVSSRSDTRGVIGMAGTDGQEIYAGPRDMQLQVRIAAEGVSPERLRALAEAGVRRSPIPSATQNATPLALQVEVA